MILIAEIFFALANLIMAWYHSRLIKDGIKIHHAWWGLGYLVFTGLISWGNHSWLLMLQALLMRKVLFDLSLNLWRGLPLFYVSKEPKSIVDKIHYKLFRSNSEIYTAFYVVAFVVINFFL